MNLELGNFFFLDMTPKVQVVKNTFPLKTKQNKTSANDANDTATKIKVKRATELKRFFCKSCFLNPEYINDT